MKKLLLLLGFISPLLLAAPITITMQGKVTTVEIDGVTHNNASFIYQAFIDDSEPVSNTNGRFRPNPGFEFSFNFLGIKDLGRSTSHNIHLVQQDLSNRFLTDITESNTGFSFDSADIDYTNINVLAAFTQIPPLTGTMTGALDPSSGNVVNFENGILDGLAIDGNATATLSIGNPIPEPSTYILAIIAFVAMVFRLGDKS